MKIFANLFKTLSAKILAASVTIIVLSVMICVFVSQQIAKNQLILLLEDEMRGFLTQSDSLTDSIGEFWESGSFDGAAMMEELKDPNLADYKESKLYNAIPVVAAWKAVRAAAEDAGLDFHVIRNNPRNPDNAPKTDLERKILQTLETDLSLDEYFVIDKATETIAYATPVVMGESCMACHGDPANSFTGDGKDPLGYAMEDWNAGERHGVYILTTPTQKIEKKVAEIRNASMKFAPILILVVCVVVFFAVKKLNITLSSIINQLGRGADEVTLAANEVSNASQTLAEGASEQAASLEETSSSMEEMKSQVVHNAGVAKETSDVSKAAASSANEGRTSMQELRTGVDAAESSAQEMNVAMNEIKESSDSISKIIKTIDEIAFQTNILALNAAVEAARAGEAGAGFAVVADEVRSLAGRAAEAAGETTKIIEDSIVRTENGVRANESVVNHLKDVLERAGKVEDGLQNIDTGVSGMNSSMVELENSVNEQSAGIDQINTALTQINDVTQTNAASAEEAASASEEMNAQALALKSVIADLQILIHGKSANGIETPGHSQLTTSKHNDFELPG